MMKVVVALTEDVQQGQRIKTTMDNNNEGMNKQTNEQMNK
jgi:hypothetical protein